MKKIVASKESASIYHGAEKYIALTDEEFLVEVKAGAIKPYTSEHFDGFRVIDGKFV